MSKLHVADGLSFSSDAITQTIAVLGNRGSGKTYGAAVLAEEMLEAKQQLVVVDPLGVWWGLRSSADGKEPGYPIVIIGGEHADVPIEEAGGKLAADFVVDSGQSVILDLVLLRKGAQKRFMLDFAEQLYHRSRSALHVMVDEADAFAPQRPQRGDERLLGAIEDWVRRGRARGIGVTLITQRSAVLNKNVLELAETLLVFRTTGPRSIDAIMAWVEHHGVEDEATAMLAELPKLDTGDAFVWSPSYLNLFKRVHIRERRTFDSSATPKPGERQRSVKSVAAVDLEKLSTEMRASADRAKADDPKELRKRIAELQAEARKTPAPAPVMDEQAMQRAVERAVASLVKESAARDQKVLRSISRLGDIFARIEMVAVDGKDALSDITTIVTSSPIKSNGHNGGDTGTVAGSRVSKPRVEPTPRRAQSSSESGTLPRGEAAILTAAAQYPHGVSREQLTVLTGYKRSSRDTYLQRLAQAGLVAFDTRGSIVATDDGVARLGDDFEPLPTGDELRAYWLNRLPLGEQTILHALIEAYPDSVDRGELSARTNYKRSSRDTYIQRLRSRKLVEDLGDSTVRASDILFDG